jgi:hypothetical protein
MKKKQTIPTMSPVDPKDYHSKKSLTVVSKSMLAKFADNPQRFYFEFFNDVDEPRKDFLAWGSLIDCLFLTPELVDRTYLVHEPMNRNRNDYKAIAKEAEAEGKTPLPSDQYDEARRAVMILKHFAQDNGIVVDETHLTQIGLYNPLTIQGQDLVLCGMADLVPTSKNGVIYDLKTTSINLNDDEAVRKHVWQYKYHAQLALYSSIINRIQPGLVANAGLLMQESKPPFTCRIVRFSPLELQLGLQWIETQLNKYAVCLRDDAFSSPLPTLDGALPNWAIRNAEQANEQEQWED